MLACSIKWLEWFTRVKRGVWGTLKVCRGNWDWIWMMITKWILKLLQTCELLCYLNKRHMIFNLGPRIFILGAYLAPWPFTQITNPEDSLNTCNFIVKGQWLVKSALSSHNHHHRPTQELNTNGWKYMNMDKFLHVSMKKLSFIPSPKNIL